MVQRIRKWEFAILLLTAFFCVVNGMQGEDVVGSTVIPKLIQEPNIYISPNAADSLDRQIDEAIASSKPNLGELAAEQAIELAKQNEQGVEQGKGAIGYSQDVRPYDSKKNTYLDASSVKSTDCSGLVLWAYNKAAEGTDVSAEDTPIITGLTDANNLEKHMTDSLVTKDDLKPGDLIFLKGTSTPDKYCYPDCADHVAIYVGDGNVVHSSTNPLQNVLATEEKGKSGTIIDGPKENDGYTWWKIQYEDGTEGWSAQELLVPMGDPSEENPAVYGLTIGSFQKGYLIQVASDDGARVRSTPTTKPTGPYMLSLENFLKLPIYGKTYEDYLLGYKHVEGADEKVSTTASKTTPAALAALGIGLPMLSPDVSGFHNAVGTDVLETSGETYFDQANDVWYIDAYSWTGSKSLYEKPAAPRYFVSGEINTYGYNWVSLPYSRTGMTYDQGYFDWCAETLASMGQSAPSAGYGLLIDDSQSGGGW